MFHDLQHKRHPEYFRWFDLPFWRALLFLSAHRSRLLIAVSEATRQDLHRFYRLPPAKVRVVGHGVDPAFFHLHRAEANPPFLLAVSTLHPHKNLDGLLQAFARFAPLHPEYRLVVAGLRGFHTGQLEALRDSLGLAERVTFTGWIPREDLYTLFAQARAFVYPSRFEGFGMPILEALAAALPTACANVEPMRGIARGAALLFDPEDPGELTRALETLAFDEPERAAIVTGRPRARCGIYLGSRCPRNAPNSSGGGRPLVRVCLDCFPFLVRSAGVKAYLFELHRHLRQVMNAPATSRRFRFWTTWIPFTTKAPCCLFFLRLGALRWCSSPIRITTQCSICLGGASICFTPQTRFAILPAKSNSRLPFTT